MYTIISKKSEVPLWLVGSMVLILIFVFVYSTAWSAMFRKGAGEVGETIGSTEDKDSDGIINLEDKCPCIKGDFSNSGCQIGYQIGADKSKEDRACIKNG